MDLLIIDDNREFCDDLKMLLAAEYGCFIAHDVGSAIRGAHIDLFIHDGSIARQLMRNVPEHVSLLVDHASCAPNYTLADNLLASN